MLDRTPLGAATWVVTSLDRAEAQLEQAVRFPLLHHTEDLRACPRRPAAALERVLALRLECAASAARILSIISPSLPAPWNRSSARIACRPACGLPSGRPFTCPERPPAVDSRTSPNQLKKPPASQPCACRRRRQPSAIRVDLVRQVQAAASGVGSRARARARKAANRHVDAPGNTLGREAIGDPVRVWRAFGADDSRRTRSDSRIFG